jgi:hypothetical protein
LDADRQSVAATLKHRADVNVYRIAIACDLTDKGGVKGQGKTGWSAWDERVKRWEAEALALGRKVLFEPITASDLIDWLGQPSAAGLARYWFGKDVLSPLWFAQQIRVASADLGERYTPDQHVDVAASLAFEGLARTASLRTRLLRAVEATWKHRIEFLSATPVDEVWEAAARANDALKRVHAIADAIGVPATTLWDVKQWLLDVRAAEQRLSLLDENLRKQERADQKSESKSRPNLDNQQYLEYNIRKTEEGLSDLERLLVSVAFCGDDRRVLLVVGEAGTGKSHLLAAEANRSVSDGRPALLFLGQQFAQGNPWDQCERSLGLPDWPRDELFGALDAAGEAAGARTLILVDAVNEGAGANLWRSHLAGFIESISPYPNVALAVACRTEYVPFAIPKPVLDAYPKVELHGFATFEEQEAAAIQYLDLRGIVRPAGPLLAPEFSHPLFLKAASGALLQKQIFAFPRGLRGALNILEFYLDSVGANLLPASAEPVNLAVELRRALKMLAQEMARTKLDYVPRRQADLIVTQAFSPRTSPAGMTWLEVLLRNGIVRLDPDPSDQKSDLFVGPEDVARIAFQRFQDLLFVQTLLSDAKDAKSLFSAGGALEWLVSSQKHYGWSGLFEALSIQIPESFEMELVDALPGGEDRWWHEWGIQQGFAQSVRWRAITSRAGLPTFTDRSLVLLNSIDQSECDPIRLLLEVAAVPEHPWNAELLHRNLWRWGLNRRDLQWSRAIAFTSDDEEHPVHRLLKWANDGNLDHAEIEILRLIAITLTWLCSSTSRYIRDTATRGLCRLLRKVPTIHHGLIKMMVEVDDLYVLERLLAASYGAACQLKDDPILETMAATIFDLVYNDRAPPQHLLARDYALGILEVAQARGRLPAMVDMTKARPPFAAKTFRAPTQATLEKRKEQIGDHSIIWSCGEHGDFGRYEISPVIFDFLETKLNAPIPLSRRNRFDLFVTEVVTIDLERKTAFKALEEASKEIWNFDTRSSDNGFKITKTRSKRKAKEAQEREEAFLCLLTHEERKRYAKDVFHFLLRDNGDRGPSTFDLKRAQRWITARAYSLGWNKQLFGEDRTPPDHGRQRGRIERIGKKYQWIALSELAALLSDTHWIKGNWGEQPKRYLYPIDLDFQRDIDPTLAAHADMQSSPEGDWWKLDFNMSQISDDQLTTWATQDDSWHSAKDAIFRVNSRNESWVTLDSFQRAMERFSERDSIRRELGLRREGFQFVHCLIVKERDLQSTYDALVAKRDRSAHHWESTNLTNGPYFGEYDWRATWPRLEWSQDSRLPSGSPVLKPVVEFSWEDHLDSSRPDGVKHRLPSHGLLDLLKLAPPTPLSPDTIMDHAGKAVFIHHKGEGGCYSVTIRKDALARLLAENQLGCLWFVSSERSAWPTGDHEHSRRRWFGSFVAFDGREINSFDWETPW